MATSPIRWGNLHCLSDVLIVGLSFDVQLLPKDQTVPTDPFDYELDILIVGNGEIVRR